MRWDLYDALTTALGNLTFLVRDDGESLPENQIKRMTMTTLESLLGVKFPRKYIGKTTAPTVNNDSGDGYAVGDRWIDETSDKEYVALNVTVGAAVWMETTGAGGGGKYPAFARCSVSSGVPNPTSDLLAQTAIYVMPYGGNTYPQWNGSDFAQQVFAQQTLTLNAAHALNSIYDMYLWLDGATQRVVTGPAWSSSTSRGTGAGTAETEDVQGVTVNKVSMTVRNGASTYTMPARSGTLVGTFVASANGQVEWSAKYRGLQNKYNKMRAGLFICPGYADDNAVTTYLTTSTSWTEANGGTGSRINFVLGEATLIDLVLTVLTAAGASSSSLYGVGLDSITQADVSGTTNNTVTAHGAISSNNKGLPIAIGAHYASLLIARISTNNATFYADAARRAGEAADSPETYITGSIMM